jgi:phasin family protein
MMHRTNCCIAPQPETPMTLQERLLEMSAQAREQADAYARRATRATRGSIDRAADQVDAIRTPVSRIAAAGLKLNQISAEFIEQLVKQQSGLAQTLIAGGARRLRSLAEAQTPREALQTQAEALEAARGHATAALRDTWTLAADTGREVAALAETTYATLRTPVHRAAKRGKKAAARARTGRAAGQAKRARKAAAAG